jgi:hypothetical protein
LATACGHDDDVHAVRWVRECPSNATAHLVMSASGDKTACLWSVTPEPPSALLVEPIDRLTGVCGLKSVTVLDVVDLR